MQGISKILRVIAVFLVICGASPAVLAATDDCTCNGTNGCTPGGTGTMGAFQAKLQLGLTTAGQDHSKSYQYGSNQVPRLDVQNHYGLNNIGGVFGQIASDISSVLAADDPGVAIATLIVNKVLSDIITNMLPHSLTSALGLQNGLACMALPSFSLSLNLSGLGFATPGNNCNGVAGSNMSFNGQSSQPSTVYGLFWGSASP